MPSLWRPNPRLLSALVLCVAWGGARCAAQSAGDAVGLDVLDNKAAARLLVDEVKPEYPPLAKVNYIQGSVRVQLWVTREGHVSQAHVVRGHPFLAEATLQAVRNWIYRPLARGSDVRGFLTFVDVKFSLHGHSMERLPPTPERDLDRQVQPPALLGIAPAGSSPDAVRMRVLVGAKGLVLDEEPIAGPATGYGAARRTVEQWQFKPARWGNHTVPWYLDVVVPTDAPREDAPGAAQADGGSR